MQVVPIGEQPWGRVATGHKSGASRNFDGMGRQECRRSVKQPYRAKMIFNDLTTLFFGNSHNQSVIPYGENVLSTWFAKGAF
jgi:hypothetical protein